MVPQLCMMLCIVLAADDEPCAAYILGELVDCVELSVDDVATEMRIP